MAISRSATARSSALKDPGGRCFSDRKRDGRSVPGLRLGLSEKTVPDTRPCGNSRQVLQQRGMSQPFWSEDRVRVWVGARGDDGRNSSERLTHTSLLQNLPTVAT